MTPPGPDPAGARSADVVVVAAGASSRMAGVDKITTEIAGRPLLAWTLDAFARVPAIERIVVVAAEARIDELRRATWLPDTATVVAGGPRRQESVAAGVTELERGGATDERIVLVHDGARPAVRSDVIERVVAATGAGGAAIPVLPVVETLKRVADGVVAGTIDRAGVAVAQTPQGVRLGVLREAYRRFPAGGADTFTDEAALLEACRIPVPVVPGHVDNVKVTVPADLDRVADILAARSPRVGVGDDSHPFGPGEPLVLGGVEIAGAPRLWGHSDGDVVLHAVADALLGAAALGDLGRLFPSDARTPRGVASAALLADVLARIAAQGLRPAGVDVTIVGARPRLGRHLEAIGERLATLLGVARGQVNVKASTGNLDGMEGAGRGISARAVATLERVR